MTLGAASFQFLAENQDLIVKGAQSEAAAKKNYEAIAQAAGVSAASVERSAKQLAGVYQKDADDRAAATLKVIKAYNDEADAADKAAAKMAASAKGFGEYAKQGLALGAALTGVTVGLATVREATDAVVDATLKAEQANRTITATYGQSAGAFKQFADQQAAAFNLTNTSVETGVARMAVLQKQYGITSDEIQKLSKVALNLGATFGDTNEAFRSVEAAIRGEPEALEKYGIALQQNAIQNSDLLTESEKKNFSSLDAVTQARIRYRIILQESAQFEGAAEIRAASAAGQFDKLSRAQDELAKAMGASLLPALGRIAAGFAEATEAAAKFIEKNREAELDAEQMGVPGALAARGLDPATGKPPVPGTVAQGPLLGPSVADVKAINAQIEAETRRHEDEQAQILLDGLKRAADARKHDLDDQKAAAEREQKQRLDAVNVERDARLQEIKDAADAAKKASQERIAQLQVDEEAAKRAASDRHDDAVAGLAAEEQAVTKAAELQIQQLEIVRDRAKEASADRRDAALRSIDDEAKAYQRASSDRLALIERDKQAETRAASDTKDADLRAIEDRAQATQKLYDGKITRAEQARDREKQAASDTKDAALRYLAEQTDATKTARELEDRARKDAEDATLRSIQARKDALADARTQEDRQRSDTQEALLRSLATQHDAAVKGFDAERVAADAADKAILAGLDARRQKADDLRTSTLAAIEAETRAARDASDQRLREIADVAAAAGRQHDQEVAAIAAAASAEADRHRQTTSAEDERHRATLANIDAETKARQDALDAQLRALDNADRAAQNAATVQGLSDRVASAQTGVLRSQSTGNQSTIDQANRDLLAAQQALTDGQNKISRDGDRQRLQDQKAALADQVKADQGAENERDRIAKAAEDERDRLEASRLTKARTDADARLKLAQDTAAGQTQAERDSLDAVLKGFDLRKTTVQATYDAEVKAIGLARDAEQVAHDKTLVDIQARKDAEASTYGATVQAAKDAYDAQARVIADRRRLEDLALDAEAAKVKATYDEETRRLGDKRVAEDKALALQQQAVRDAYDAEIRKLAETYDDPVKGVLAKLRQQASDAKDRYADRKRDVTAAYDAEVRSIHDVYDDPVTGLLAQQRKQAADASEQYGLRKRATQDAYDAEQRQIKATYDDPTTGAIPAIHRALDAAKGDYGQRKTLIDITYQAEQRQIADTYTNEQTGLIPAQRRAEADAADKFNKIAASVRASAESQRASIQAAYRAPDGKSGILDQIDESKRLLDEQLAKEEQKWRDFQKGLTGDDGVITKGWADAKKAADEYFDEVDKRRRAQAATPSAPSGGSSGPGSGPGSGPNDPRPGQPGGPLGPAVPGGPTVGPGGPGAPNRTDLTAAAAIMQQQTPQVVQWLQAAMSLTNDPGSELAGLLNLTAQESSGNPRAVNPTTVNGEHASGLLQTLPSTFRSNAVKDHGDIWNPVDNAAAAIQYIKGRYGSVYDTDYYSTGIFNPQGVRGYGDGGFIPDPRLLMDPRTGRIDGIMAEQGGEWIMPTLPTLPSLAGALPALAASGAAGVTSGAQMNRYELRLQLGGREWELAVFDAIGLNIRSGNIQEIRR